MSFKRGPAQSPAQGHGAGAGRGRGPERGAVEEALERGEQAAMEGELVLAAAARPGLVLLCSPLQTRWGCRSVRTNGQVLRGHRQHT